MFEEQKFAFVAYSGKTCSFNRSSWFKVPVSLWKILRYQLERFGAEEVESMMFSQTQASVGYDNKMPGRTSFLRGFIAHTQNRYYRNPDQLPTKLMQLCTENSELIELCDLNEIKSDDTVFANSFLFLVQESMPLGAKPYMPYEETFKYNYLLEKMSCRTDDKDELYAKLQFELQELKEQNKSNTHASDLDIQKAVVRSLNATTSYAYVKPSMEYLCNSCRQYGHHLPDACFLWKDSTNSHCSTSVFGPNKCKSAKLVDENDSMFYKLLYQKIMNISK